jgi:hypothetical protein
VKVPEADAAVDIARNEVPSANIERNAADSGTVSAQDVRDLLAFEKNNKNIVGCMRKKNARVDTRNGK